MPTSRASRRTSVRGRRGPTIATAFQASRGTISGLPARRPSTAASATSSLVDDNQAGARSDRRAPPRRCGSPSYGSAVRNYTGASPAAAHES
jgi:hypothetical protein